MIDNSNVIDGRYKTYTVYRVARNFCRSLLYADWKLIFAISKNLFFSMRTNFCDFQKVPSTFPVSRSLSRRGKSERKTERPLLAGNQCPALMIFWFLLSTCNQGAMEYRISSNNSHPSIYRLPRIITPPPLYTFLPSSLFLIPPCPCQVQVESHAGKLISDDSSSDAEDIDIEK